jgi:Iap family predicted aminopeptidase
VTKRKKNLTSSNIAIDQQIVGDIYTSSEALENLFVLCDEFGSRFGGSEGERKAAEYIARKLNGYGLSNVHLEPFEYLGWVRGETVLEITSPIKKQIQCITLPHSPAASIEGPIIDLADGYPDDFARSKDQIAQKIVLTTSESDPRVIKRWVHRMEKYGRSVLAGAKGFIFANHYPGYGPATGGIGLNNEPAPIPGVAINKEDGAFLQRLVKRHGVVKIHLKSTDRFEGMTSWNVIGELTGDAFPDEIVMLGSHYDGHDISQGAVDPASGVVTVLEVARVLSRYAMPLPRTLRFALWGVEEIGLLGSRHYVKAHAEDLQNIRFYLNLDSAGGPFPKDINLHAWPALQTIFEHYRNEMATEFAIGQTFHTASDHFPFLLNGVVTGGLEPVRSHSVGRGYGHTFYDTVDKVSQTDLRDAAALASRIVMRVAKEEEWPVAQRDGQTVSELMNSPAMREVQQLREQLSALSEQ